MHQKKITIDRLLDTIDKQILKIKKLSFLFKIKYDLFYNHVHIDQFLNSNQQPLNITYYSPDGFSFYTLLYSWDDVMVLHLQYCEVIMNLMVPIELP